MILENIALIKEKNHKRKEVIHMRVKSIIIMLIFVLCLGTGMNISAEGMPSFNLTAIHAGDYVGIGAAQPVMVSVINGDDSETYTYEWSCSEGYFEEKYVGNETVWVKPVETANYSETVLWQTDREYIAKGETAEIHVYVTVTSSKGESVTEDISFTLGRFLGGSVTTHEKKGVKNWDREINELFMGNYFSEETFDKLYQDRIDQYNESIWPNWLEFIKRGRVSEEGYANEHVEMYEAYYSGLDYNNGLRISLMNTPGYMLQYAKENCLEYVLSDKYYWNVYSDDAGIYWYDENGNYCNSVRELYDDEFHQEFHITDEAYELLKNPEAIESQLLDMGVTEVLDIKLFATRGSSYLSFMYIKTNNEEYLVLLNEGWVDKVPSIDGGKVYEADEVVKAIVEKTGTGWISRQNLIPLIEKEKNTFESEARILYEKGLMQGNEKGLDLLKPLTRAEAVTLLVRAWGLESETEKYRTSAFSDVADDNWAAPYIALAKDKGTTTGISETEFAPDELVSANQFATFILRNAGEGDVDYTKALQELIEREILNDNETETMDFFTRGDAAKLIYEAVENGVIP